MIYFFRKYSKEELYGERKDTKPEMVNGVEKKYVCYRSNCNSRCCFKQTTSSDVTYEFDDHSISPIFRNPNEKTTTVTYSKQVIPALETEEKYKEIKNEANEGLC
jgi:hypothetical protein